MKNIKPYHCFIVKTVLAFFMLAISTGIAFCDDAPKPKPALRIKPNISSSIPKPWTDFVIDSLHVKRDSRGNIQAMVTVKNLGAVNKGPLWVAIGINRPGARMIEIGYGSSNAWYALIGKANINETVEIKAIVDSKEVINEIKEDNNECSVHLAPGVTIGSSFCY